MKVAELLRKRFLLALFVALGIWSLLIYQHFHGGVPSHHLLQRSDLPSVSNWWGGILLPCLTWFLVGRINRREGTTNSNAVIGCFVGALVYGIALSVSFVNGYEQILSLMGPGLLVVALFFPIYMAQYFLGFVIGMTYTFGAILPTAFGVVVGLISFVIYNYIRPIPLFIFQKLNSGNKA